MDAGYGRGAVCGNGMWVRHVGTVHGSSTRVRCEGRVHVIKLAPANCSSTDIVWDGLGWVGKGSAHFLRYSYINFAGIMLVLRSHLLRQKVVGLICLPMVHVLPITF